MAGPPDRRRAPSIHQRARRRRQSDAAHRTHLPGSSASAQPFYSARDVSLPEVPEGGPGKWSRRSEASCQRAPTAPARSGGSASHSPRRAAAGSRCMVASAMSSACTVCPNWFRMLSSTSGRLWSASSVAVRARFDQADTYVAPGHLLAQGLAECARLARVVPVTARPVPARGAVRARAITSPIAAPRLPRR